MQKQNKWVIGIVVVALALVSWQLWQRQAPVTAPAPTVSQVAPSPVASLEDDDNESQFAMATIDATGGEFEVDFGDSGTYSNEELAAAVTTIMAEFNTWDGCEMHSLTYNDELSLASETDLYAQQLEPDKEYVDVVVFDSSFHSPVNPPPETAWEPDTEYTWSWYLARPQGGAWELLTWGYG